MKKKLIYFFIPILIFILLFSIAASCSSGSSTAKKVETTISANASEATSTETTSSVTTEQQIYNVGDSVELKGALITVVSFKKSSGSDFDKPKEGTEYIIVSLKIKNNGDNKVSYNPFYFKMQNSKGQITDMALTTVNQDNALASGELASGGEVEGTVAFEEPKDDSGLVLIYQANMLNENEVIKFNIK